MTPKPKNRPCAGGRQISREDRLIWAVPCPRDGTEWIYFADEKWGVWMCLAHSRLLLDEVEQHLREED